jgi:hypothetical protein
MQCLLVPWCIFRNFRIQGFFLMGSRQGLLPSLPI